MSLTVVVVGSGELRRKLRQLPAAMGGQALRAAVQAGALVVQNDAKERAPYRTGNLRRSIHSEVTESTPFRCAVQVGTNVEYAPAVEFGSGIHGPKKEPYVIRPRRKKALYWPGAKHPVRRVIHPGVKARPFLGPAFKAKKHAATEEVCAALRQQLRYLRRR